MNKAIRKGAPPCGLWLRLGPDLAPDVLMRDLRQVFFVINGSAYEKNMHALEVSGDESDPAFKAAAAVLLAQARDNGIAAVFRGSPECAQEIEADGVLVDDPDKVAAARALFGEAGLVGVACGLSNEAAAASYDAGVDFVTFGTGGETLPDAGILKFWTVLTDLPAVIEGPVSNDYAAYYVQAGAGFIEAGPYIWSHGKGLMQGTVNMLHAIDLALEDMHKPAVQ